MVISNIDGMARVNNVYFETNLSSDVAGVVAIPEPPRGECLVIDWWSRISRAASGNRDMADFQALVEGPDIDGANGQRMWELGYTALNGGDKDLRVLDVAHPTGSAGTTIASEGASPPEAQRVYPHGIWTAHAVWFMTATSGGVQVNQASIGYRRLQVTDNVWRYLRVTGLNDRIIGYQP